MLYTKLTIKLIRTFGLLVACSIPGVGSFFVPFTYGSYVDTFLTSIGIAIKTTPQLGEQKSTVKVVTRPFAGPKIVLSLLDFLPFATYQSLCHSAVVAGDTLWEYCGNQEDGGVSGAFGVDVADNVGIRVSIYDERAWIDEEPQGELVRSPEEIEQELLKWKFLKYDFVLNNCQHFAYNFGQWLVGKRESSLDLELLKLDGELEELLVKTDNVSSLEIGREKYIQYREN